MASILIQTEGEEPRKFTLEAATVTLGRGLESDIRLKDIKSSRRHCQIVKGPSGFEVVDLSSGNGTYVNGAPVKQHKLAAGDKIRIGGTIITFIDGETARPATVRTPAAAPAKGPGGGASTARTATARKPTGPIPAAAPPADRPAGATSRTGLPRPATGPTKKITSGVPVRKPPTQFLPAAQPSAPALDRPSTASLKKGATQRTGHTTRSTGHVSATQRFHAESRRKRVNPVVAIIGLIVVAFGAVLGFILFGGGDDIKYVKPQYDRLIAEGGKAYQENRFDEALVAYEKALKLVEPHEVFKRHAIEVRKIIEEVKNERAQMEAVTKEFKRVKALAEDKSIHTRQRWEETKNLLQRVGDAAVPWLKELKDIHDRLGKDLDEERKAQRGRDFLIVRADISKRHGLGSREKADYNKAILAYREYIDGDPGEENRRKAEEEIKRLGDQIAEAVDELRRKAGRLIDDGKKDQALEFLKNQRPRFEKTSGEGALEKVIRDVEKR